MSLPAKKQIWRDNTEPPKNYIWKKTSDAGVELGTYIYNGKAWVKIANGPGNAGSVSPSVINSIYASDEEGRTTTLKYSKDAEPLTLAQRTETGAIRAAEPTSENEVVTMNMLIWQQE